MKKIVFSILVLLATATVQAQPTNGLRLATAFSGNSLSTALDFGQERHFGKKQRLIVGYGARYTRFQAADAAYLTAPAKLTGEGKIDTLMLSSPRVNSLNAYLLLGYQILPKWSLSFDIDLIGFSWGNERAGIFGSTEDPRFNGLQVGKPTAGNFLLVGDNDRGSLNSNFSVRYTVNEQWQVQAGLSYLFTEFSTTNTLTDENNRFRNKSSLAMVGVRYNF